MGRSIVCDTNPFIWRTTASNRTVCNRIAGNLRKDRAICTAPPFSFREGGNRGPVGRCRLNERDNFTHATIRNLAQRVGFRCSFTDCGKLTIGPNPSGEGTINIGVAAHICAASPGGKRYDPQQTPEERRSQSNGMWLCQIHAHFIDQHDHAYPVDKLKQLKLDAERQCYLELVTLTGAKDPQNKVDVPEFDEPPNEELARTVLDVRKRASDDLKRFRSVSSWPTHPVGLRLSIRGADGAKAETDYARLADAFRTFTDLHLISSAGTGKTTTLLQIAGALIDNTGPVPLYLPLAEWSIGSGTFFEAARSRAAFATAEKGSFELLASSGNLLLILDGWNELSAPQRERAVIQILALRRDYPDVGVVISTRRQVAHPPLTAPEVEIEPLDDSQKREIATARRAAEGIGLLKRASKSGLSDLISTPIYFDAFLSQNANDSIPRSKGEVLDGFVSRYENNPLRREVLHAVFSQTHHTFLVAIAGKLTRTSSTAIAEREARLVVSRVQQKLMAEGQIGVGPSPAALLEVLAGRHLLSRRDDGAIAFQHQVFLEWYSSFEVEELMKASTVAGHTLDELRTEVLNQPAWEEAILFACERISQTERGDSGQVSEAILQTMNVDPILAGRMIRRSAPTVWSELRDRTVSWVRKWFAAEYDSNSRDEFFDRVPRPFRLMLLLNDEKFDNEISSRLKDVDSKYCATLLKEVERTDLEPPPPSRYFGSFFSRALFMTASMRPDSAPIRATTWKDVDTGYGRSATEYDFEAAAKIGNSFWNTSGLDEGQPTEDYLASYVVLSDREPLEQSKVAAYFAARSAVPQLLDKIFRMQRLIVGSEGSKASQRAAALSRLRTKISCSHVVAFAEGILDRKDDGTLSQMVTLADLIACHGAYREYWRPPQGPLPAAQPAFSKLVDLVRRWIELSCQDPNLSQQDCLTLAAAVARLPSMTLLPSLNRLLVSFLKLRNESRDPDGDDYWNEIVFSRSGASSFGSPFMKAFLNIGGGPTIRLLQERMGENSFALEAACVLLRMHDSAFDFVPDLGSARSRRNGRASENDESADDPVLAQALGRLNETVERLLERGRHRVAVRVAQAALSMDGTVAETTARSVLDNTEFPLERSMLLKRLAIAGFEIRSNDIVQTLGAISRFDHLFFYAKESFLKDTTLLFLFSDKPQLIAEHIAPFRWSLKKPFWSLVGRASVKAAEEALFSLSRADPHFAKDDGWISAVTAVGTETAAQTLIGMCRDEQCSLFIREWSKNRSLFKQLFDRHPACRIDLTKCDVWMKQRDEDYDLLLLASCTDDEDTLFRLMTAYVAVERKYDAWIRGFIADYVCPEPNVVPPLQMRSRIESVRKRLFEESAGADARAALARRCLTDVDDYRDMGADGFGETRHPDISSGRPWPALPIRENI